MNRLKELRKSRKMNQTELSEALHISQSTLSNWENERVKIDNVSMQQIAAFFDVSLDYLMGTDVYPSASGHLVPVLTTIRSGIPVAAIEDIECWEAITTDMAKTGEFVALRIKGNSMEPQIKEGDIAIIRRQETVGNGDIAAVLVNGNEATIKKVKFSPDGMMLIAFNTAACEPYFYNKEEIAEIPVRIYGKLVEVRRKFQFASIE